jgi:hypothetical protein
MPLESSTEQRSGEGALKLQSSSFGVTRHGKREHKSVLQQAVGRFNACIESVFTFVVHELSVDVDQFPLAGALHEQLGRQVLHGVDLHGAQALAQGDCTGLGDLKEGLEIQSNRLHYF